MEFKKLPSNSKKLLDEILQADNSVQMLCERFESASKKEDEELRGILKELREEGFVNVNWASNKPYCVNIGDGNKISNSKIANAITNDSSEEKKSFFEKHPVICSFLISLAAGVVLLFSFWPEIVKWIEGVF